MTTLTVDSDYVRDIRKERFSTPIFLLLLKLVPAKTEMNLLLKKSKGFLECESEEDQNRLADLFRKLDAEILNVPGGHVGFIVQSEHYIDLMEKFLKEKVI